MEQINLFVVGTCPNPTTYGAAAVLSCHIAAQYAQEGTGLQIRIPGNAPFSLEVKVDGVIVMTKTDIPVCVDPNDETEYNCVLEIPCGVVSLRGWDSTLPEPLDFRAINNWTVVSPPFATMNGIVDPGGAETTVKFYFGTTTEYGRIASGGTINGFNPLPVSKKLSSKKDGGDPVEFLEPETEYHYKIVAENYKGITESADMTFWTPSYVTAPIVTVLPASNIS